MSALTDLFGPTLLGAEGKTVNTADLKADVVGIYFSAHWCGPCRGFTPSLASFYKDFEAKNPGKFEIVFASSDRDQAAFDGYFGEMPWKALPFAERDIKNKLSKKFKCNGIPYLVLVDAKTGETITSEGRMAVMRDPQGADFPWRPKALAEVLGSGKLVDGKGTEYGPEVLKGKVIGLYFSAHWCPPCRAWTPEFAKTYSKLVGEGKNFEVVFCSSDRDEASFKEYLGEMPWKALPFGDKRKDELSQRFKVEGIPTLVVVDETGTTITTNGRMALQGDPEGKEFPWLPKPLNELTGASASGLNESAQLVGFAADGSETAVQTVKEAMSPVAAEYVEAQKRAGKEQELGFMFVGEDEDDIAAEVVRFASLKKAARPFLLLLDIPSQQKYLLEGPVTEEAVRKVCDEFVSGKLQLVGLRG